MFYELLKRSSKIVEEPFKPGYIRLISKPVAKDGKLVRTSVFERTDPVQNMSKFKMEDFNLGNILAVGAYDMLKPTYMTDMSSLGAASAVETVINSLKDEASQK